VLERYRARFTLSWGRLSPDGSLLETSGGTVSFTWHEAALLRVLARGRGSPVPRDALGYALWGKPPRPGSRAVDAHVAAIRRKIAAACPPGSPPPIVAVRRRGYMVR
jgi:DNA-binding response OmpR family regulator